MITFTRKCEMLTELGVEYYLDHEYRGKVGVDRKSYDVDIFEQIKPPFTAEDWINLCSNEGRHYLGGCCGTLSALQDMLEGWFRFDMDYLNTQKIEEVEERLISHGDGEWWTKEGDLEDIFIEAKVSWDTLPPLEKLAYVWAIIKGHHNTEALPRSPRKDYDKFQSDIHLVNNLAQNISWSHLFCNPEDRDAQWSANQQLAMARMLPAIKGVYDKLHSITDTFEGYALIDLEREGDDNICDNGKGACIYGSLKEVWDLLDSQQEYYDEYEERDKNSKRLEERYAARAVTISLENGMVFTSELITKPKELK